MSPRTEINNQKIRDDRREQIIQAALKIFAHKGLKATKISDIATAVGISQGLIHHYFSSKEAVYATVAERAMLGGLHALDEAPPPGTTPWERLTSMCERMLQGMVNYPEYLLVIIQCYVTNDIPLEMRELISGHGNSLFSNVVQLICEGQDVGQIVAGDPVELAVVFFATIQGLVLMQFTQALFIDEASSGIVSPRAETVLHLLKA
jgi:AcrR family transcriptional regulator